MSLKKIFVLFSLLLSTFFAQAGCQVGNAYSSNPSVCQGWLDQGLIVQGGVNPPRLQQPEVYPGPRYGNGGTRYAPPQQAQPVYVQPSPVYVAPPVYVQRAPVVVVRPTIYVEKSTIVVRCHVHQYPNGSTVRTCQQQN